MATPTSTQPATLTVEEAAQVLRIGRTTAYALAREWRTTGGRSGLPVLELGRTLRVPRAALDRILDVHGSTPSQDDRAKVTSLGDHAFGAGTSESAVATPPTSARTAADGRLRHGR